VLDHSVCQLEPWQTFTDSTMGRLIDDRMTSLIAWHVCLTCIGMLPQTLYSLFPGHGRCCVYIKSMFCISDVPYYL
jgi:hypothetical protein